MRVNLNEKLPLKIDGQAFLKVIESAFNFLCIC